MEKLVYLFRANLGLQQIYRTTLRKIASFLLLLLKIFGAARKAVLNRMKKLSGLACVLGYLSILSKIHVVPFKFDAKEISLVETQGLRKFVWYLLFFGVATARSIFLLVAPLLQMVRFKPVGTTVDEKDLDMLVYLVVVPPALLFLIVLWTYHFFIKEICWVFRMYFVLDKQISGGFHSFRSYACKRRKCTSSSFCSSSESRTEGEEPIEAVCGPQYDGKGGTILHGCNRLGGDGNSGLHHVEISILQDHDGLSYV